MRKSAARAAAANVVLDPNTITGLYGMVITGSCMAPAYPDGAIVRVCPEEPYKKGDVVVAWIRPEFRKPGRTPALIKRIVMMPPPYVTFPYKEHPKSEVFSLVMLGQDDRPAEMLSVRCIYLSAIHKVVGLLKPDECSFERCDELAERAR